MHCEQGNKMAFHAIILCNKTPEARKMINNVSCVRQLLPKIKRSSAPSAARLGRKCGRRRSRRSRVPAGAHAAAAPARPLRPRESAECSRGGRQRAPSSGRGQERAGSPRRARHPRRQQRLSPGRGAQPGCSHLRLGPLQRRQMRDSAGLVTSRLCAEPGAGSSLVLSRKLCVLPVHHCSC